MAQYIVKDFDPDVHADSHGWLQQDQIIRSDHLLYTDDEIATFPARSNARCPTFGNCTLCWCPGPVGNRCTICYNGGIYKVVKCHHLDLPAGPQSIVDAEHLAELIGVTGSQPAKADRTFSWLRTPTVVVRKAQLARWAFQHHAAAIKELQESYEEQLFGRQL